MNNAKLTILLPNFFQYERVNEILYEFSNCNHKNTKLLILDAGDELLSKDKIVYPQNNLDITTYFGLDNGIYNALNFGINQVNTKYYMVLGVDDIFDFSKIDMVIKVLKDTHFDLLFLGIKKSGIISNSLKIDSILSGPQGVFPSHTGGMIINKYLHEKYGKYSYKYKVLADSYFVSKCLLDKDVRFGLLGDIFCDVGDQGFSKKKELLAEYEAFIIRNELGQKLVKSYTIYFTRVSKRIVKMVLKSFGFRK